MRENYDEENKKPLQIELEELDKDGDTPSQETETNQPSKDKKKEEGKTKEKKEEKTIIDLIGRKRKNENKQSKENKNINSKNVELHESKDKDDIPLDKKEINLENKAFIGQPNKYIFPSHRQNNEIRNREISYSPNHKNISQIKCPPNIPSHKISEETQTEPQMLNDESRTNNANYIIPRIYLYHPINQGNLNNGLIINANNGIGSFNIQFIVSDDNNENIGTLPSLNKKDDTSSTDWGSKTQE